MNTLDPIYDELESAGYLENDEDGDLAYQGSPKMWRTRIVGVVVRHSQDIPTRTDEEHYALLLKSYGAADLSFLFPLWIYERNYEAILRPLRPKRRPSAELIASQRAWKNQYIGPYADMLYADLIRGNVTRLQQQRNWANYLPIVQSSGMGKSRTVHEVGRMLYAIPLNVREDKYGDANGYPFPDASIREFLERADRRVSSFTDKRRYLAIFLSALFEKIVAAMLQLHEEEGYLTPLLWQAHLDGRVLEECPTDRPHGPLEEITEDQGVRSMLYDGVIHHAETLWDGIKHTRGSVSPVRPLHRGSSSGLASNHPPTVRAYHQDDMVDHFLAKVERQLSALEKIQLINERSPLLLVLDECHALTKVTVDTPASSLQILCHLLDSLKHKPMMAIYVTTNSNIRRIAWNARANNAAVALVTLDEGKILEVEGQAPYTEFGFDDNGGEAIITENGMKLEEACTLPFMCRFGRALWPSLLKASLPSERILEIARQKLTGGGGAHETSYGSKLAVYSVRLGLRYEADTGALKVTQKDRDKAVQEELKQVESHMRVVFAAPAHHEYIYSGTPSEPILAEAAAQIMRHHSSMRDPVEFLVTELSPLVDKGQRGQLAARVLLMKARDAAVPGFNAAIPVPGMICTQPVLFIDLLKALLAEKWHPLLRRCFPTHKDATSESLEQAFEKAYVNFTHFAQAKDTSAFRATNLWKAAARGCAWECPDNMAWSDFGIPVILDIDKPLGTDNVTVLFLQIEDSIQFPTILSLPDDADKLMFGETGPKKPWVFIGMHLGVQPTSAASTAPLAPSPSPTPTRTQSKSTTKASLLSTLSKDQVSTDGSEKLPGRYDITIIGCSPTVYGVIDQDGWENNRTHWAQLLGSKSIIDEHPRKGAETHFYADPDAWTDAMRRSKPWFDKDIGFFWARKNGSAPPFVDDDLPDEIVHVSGDREDGGRDQVEGAQ